MNNPDILMELAQLHQLDLRHEAAQERAAHAVQRKHADQPGHAAGSLRALLMGWIAAQGTKRSRALPEQSCCACCPA